MELIFDLAEDEFPIFMAETDEQLQVLDDGLIRLEREGENMELLQALFRAAHTLKGTSGMIGHKRMVNLTHSMETALDCLRKHTIQVTTGLIDLCLEATDALRNLREEVITRTQSDVAVDELTDRFSALVLAGAPAAQSAAAPSVPAPTVQPSAAQMAEVKQPEKPAVKLTGGLLVRVEISQNSIASAARAFQVMMELQGLGTIKHMSPTQEEIETSKPVHIFTAELETAKTDEDILKALDTLSELDKVEIFPAGTPLQAPVVEEPVPDLPVTELTAPVPAATRAAPKSPAASAEPVASGNTARSGGAPVSVEKTVRTSVERLDNLMNLVGELITDRNRLYQIRGTLEACIRNSNQMDVLSDTITHVGRITDQLQMEVMGIRMLPISNTFSKFPRMVRDLSLKLNKKIDLVIEGENTELDRSVIEEINDPLIHLIRNSVDHGIESAEERKAVGKPERARIKLTARHEQGRIILTVEDDGKGIDPDKIRAVAVSKGILSETEAGALGDDEAINLIFSSGFSTAKVINDVSGRGVGLDIVRNNIQRLNGTVLVETEKGKGSRFMVTLPLTLAIVPTLLVKIGVNTLAIPLVTVLETLRISTEEISSVNSKPVIRLRDKVLPLLEMADAFGYKSAKHEQSYRYVVVVGMGKQQMGLAVDHLLGQEEVVVKSLGSIIGEVVGIASAAILGDGSVILIVDVQDLFQVSGQKTGSNKKE
ncbi:MAG: chemotaxis protein CheA [Leptolinea sp.]|jgi:two-component system chemotaxis sensor kinase CheA|nr:chemotaxis protein CheA [Leptolinea sp.]